MLERKNTSVLSTGQKLTQNIATEVRKATPLRKRGLGLDLSDWLEAPHSYGGIVLRRMRHTIPEPPEGLQVRGHWALHSPGHSNT